jgi:hypothetical protein
MLTTATMNARYAIKNKDDRNNLFFLRGGGSGSTGCAVATANSSKWGEESPVVASGTVLCVAVRVSFI